MAKDKHVVIEDLPAKFLPTAIEKTYANGLVIARNGAESSGWFFATVPLGSVKDAPSAEQSDYVQVAMLRAINAVTGLMPDTTLKRRSIGKRFYRRFVSHTISLPYSFDPGEGAYNRDELKSDFSHRKTPRRICVIGIELETRLGGENRNFRSIARDAIENFMSSNTVGEHNPRAYAHDLAEVKSKMLSAGLRQTTAREINEFENMFSGGQEETYYIVSHSNHVHFCKTESIGKLIEETPADECSKFDQTPDHHVITFMSLVDANFDFIDGNQDPRARWGSELLDGGALSISMSGVLEPPEYTRSELRANHKRNEEAIRKKWSAAKDVGSEEESDVLELKALETEYAKGANASVIDLSVTIAYSGRFDSPEREISTPSAIQITTMPALQVPAMRMHWLGNKQSVVRHRHEWPAQNIAYAGLNSLSVAGDGRGVCIGFTQDGQSALINEKLSSHGDKLPYFLCAGDTGSGKTMVLLRMATEYAKAKVPGIIIDYKPESDHSAVVDSVGGTTNSLDSLLNQSGVFDPMGFSENIATGVELAVNALIFMNVWGVDNPDSMETQLKYSIRKSVETEYNEDGTVKRRGCRYTGEAIEWASKLDPSDEAYLPPSITRAIFMARSSYPTFEACIGFDPDQKPLRQDEGLRYIRLGSMSLGLPAPGADPRQTTVSQRIALSVARMSILGSAMALTGRGGVLYIDEAWIFLSATGAELEELGRLSRTYQIFPCMFTQRVSDAVNAGLTGFISRVLILGLRDRKEALAACAIAKIDPHYQGRLDRILAPADIPSTEGGEASDPNPDSLRAQYRISHNGTRQFVRGSQGILVDSNDRSAIITIDLPPTFLKSASTNAGDIDLRKRENLLKKTNA